MKNGVKVLFSASSIARQVARIGKKISRDYAPRTVDVVAFVENSFLFVSDLIRQIKSPVVCHLVRAEIRNIHVGGFERKEIFFSPEPLLKGRDVLLVDAVLHTGVTLDFWAKRLQHSKPHSLKTVVLIDKPADRKVDLRPDYFCFQSASKYLVGYGLPGPNGQYRNLPFVGALKGSGGRGGQASAARARRSRGKAAR